MIECIQGTPGSGKSAVGVLQAIDHLMMGGVIATNFDLVEGWADKLADMNILCKMGFRDRATVAQSYYDRTFKIGKPNTLYELATKINDLVSPRMKKKREGKALVVLDEAQLYFNSRNWQENMGFIEYFTQHRKLGFDVTLIAHFVEMIDKQVRPLIEIESMFRNMKNVRIPLVGISSTLGANVFFVVRKYAGMGPGKGLRHSMSTYMLNKQVASLYDTCEVFAFNQLPDELTSHGTRPAGPGQNKRPPKTSFDVNASETFPKYHEAQTRTSIGGSGLVCHGSIT